MTIINALANIQALFGPNINPENFESDETKRLRTGNKYLVTIWYKLPTLCVAYDSDTPPFMLKKYSGSF
ncbi:hypothetical protein NVS47_01240 [Dehalobacterium formicoaceticum]|uniref:Uncharacterized protein n=1 Tax=Dehalobacterium formicoaceticum TaxID=51515 RepID=A0ABT1Y0Q4_9FIRM|nr:hypothetical protein [Dehalobacterium formicoaceticum]MCR6544148.1 hypothetical protein [Dehalobacterium formicoaceticum]